MTPAPILADALKLDGIRHGFFTREGGVSEGIYASLNCGLGSGDDRERVIENRNRVAASLGVEAGRVATVYQVHSADALTMTGPFEGPPPKADAMVTREKGLALGALAADCAPILFADPDAGVVGAAHAGWRGALSGIGDETVAAMERLGAHRSAIRAVVGPCIGPENYEIGPEFAAAFMEADTANAAFFRAGERPGHAFFDLPGYVAARLSGLGLFSVDTLGRCTYAEPETFFSYRRKTHLGEADYGRQISAICLH